MTNDKRTETHACDLISRQAAIDAENIEEFKKNLSRTINTGIVATNTKDVYSCGMRNGMRWCRYLIDDEPPKFEKAREWIPCSERLPERYDNYLITTEDGMVVFGVYDPREKQWCRYDSIKSWWIYGIKVLAWQPLPTPYREGGQDEQ